jgi:hypothetical protein
MKVDSSQMEEKLFSGENPLQVMLLMGSSKTENVLVDLYGINSRVSGRNLINP